MRRCDPLPDPEDVRDPATGRRGIDNFESFMKFLAPVGRGAIGDERARRRTVCSTPSAAPTCHVPALDHGPERQPLFDRVTVPLFSDLLLHDIGTGDGIAQGAARPDEIRTPALWGLRLRRPLLHDGSAATIEDAIRATGAKPNWRGGLRTTVARRTGAAAGVPAFLVTRPSSRSAHPRLRGQGPRRSARGAD